MKLCTSSVLEARRPPRAGLPRLAAAGFAIACTLALIAWQSSAWLGQDAHRELVEPSRARQVALDESQPTRIRVAGIVMLAHVALRDAASRRAVLDTLHELEAAGGDLGETAALYVRHIQRKEQCK